MHKKQLTEKLYENHSAFIEYINSLTDHEFVYDQSAKWTAGQQISHIILSVRPLVQIFRLPHFILKIILKRSNRPGRSFDELVNKYLSKLQNGGRATGRFVPES